MRQIYSQPKISDTQYPVLPSDDGSFRDKAEEAAAFYTSVLPNRRSLSSGLFAASALGYRE
jgi:hypothetical protein